MIPSDQQRIYESLAAVEGRVANIEAALEHRQDGELLALSQRLANQANCEGPPVDDLLLEAAAALRTLAASPRGVEVTDESRSLKQIPPAKQYPEPDEHGNDTGTCCQWAYTDGFNEGRALVLAALSQPSGEEGNG